MAISSIQFCSNASKCWNNVEGQATLDAFEVKDVTEIQTGETKEYFDFVVFSNIDFSYPNTEENF